jgi:hypothetical protein
LVGECDQYVMGSVFEIGVTFVDWAAKDVGEVYVADSEEFGFPADIHFRILTAAHGKEKGVR